MSAEVSAEVDALLAKHGPSDPAVMLTPDQMWAVLSDATSETRTYLLGRWSDGVRCLLAHRDAGVTL